MPFAVPPPDYHLSRPQVATFSQYKGVQYREGASNRFGITSRTMSVIRFGQTAYRLRTPVEGAYYPPASSHSGEFIVDGFQRAIVGRGRSPEKAYQDWLIRFHADFQRLYMMRPFEMDDQDRSLWSVMEREVDVEQYRARQSLIVLQQGKVCRARPYPEKVQWEDGTTERICLERMPGEFATYKAGQPFEALVHRDSVSHTMIKVEYVRRVQNRASQRPEESRRLIESLPTSASLPDSDWD